MAQNGHDPVEAMLAQAEAQRQQEQAITLILRNTLQQPAIAHQITGPNLPAIVRAGDDRKILMIAVANGERFDLPLDPPTLRRLMREAVAGDDVEAEAQQEPA